MFTGSSQPRRSTDSQDSAVAAPGPEWSYDDPLSALADAMIEEVSTKVSSTETPTSPSSLNETNE